MPHQTIFVDKQVDDTLGNDDSRGQSALMASANLEPSMQQTFLLATVADKKR